MTADTRKLRGGYYTPDSVARYLARWAIKSRRSRVLEPSAGDGVFVAACQGLIGKTGELVAVELFPEEAAKARIRVDPPATVFEGDVFSWYTREMDGSFDAVVGNPPFIRYQTFPEAHRAPAFALMNQAGLRPNRMTNAWVPFVTLATRALKDGGRLAMVIPAELLQVTYAGELRAYLATAYSELTVVTFRDLIFEGIQQEVVLLLGVRGSDNETAKMGFVELDGISTLTREVTEVDRVIADLDHGREKWTQYYLSNKELGLIREIEQSDKFRPLRELASVNVGIVTGRNEFFVLSRSEALNLGVLDSCLPLIGRSAQVPGLFLDEEEWESLLESDSKCLLLQLGATERADLSPDALAYVRSGEAQGFTDGYKCRIRLPNWWNVPSVGIPDAFMLRQIYDGPRIINNLAGATCTDTIHRVRVREGVDSEWLASASMNSVTYAFAEIRGRSYGGGVLELEPTEAESLPFPVQGSTASLADLDLWVRRKETEQVLREVDRLVLSNCGLSASDLTTVRSAWSKLSNRRRQRKVR